MSLAQRKKKKNTSDPKECPVCGQEYAKVATIRSGTHWKDMYQGTLYDYLTRYKRRCSGSVNVEDEDARLRPDEVVLYFHGDTRKVGRPL